MSGGRARLFIGNLASEKTSQAELRSIFEPYGRITEKLVIRRSFGFVQFDTMESAQAALNGEQGRAVGGLKIDLSMADNRAAGGGGEGRGGGGGHWRRSRSPPQGGGGSGGGGRRRSRSPPRGGGGPPPDGPALRILLLGFSQREPVEAVVNSIRDLDLAWDSLQVEANRLAPVLEHAERQGVKYLLTITTADMRDGTAGLRVLFRDGFQKTSTRAACAVCAPLPAPIACSR